jgi:hypothetical protein
MGGESCDAPHDRQRGVNVRPWLVGDRPTPACRPSGQVGATVRTPSKRSGGMQPDSAHLLEHERHHERRRNPSPLGLTLRI